MRHMVEIKEAKPCDFTVRFMVGARTGGASQKGFIHLALLKQSLLKWLLGTWLEQHSYDLDAKDLG